MTNEQGGAISKGRNRGTRGRAPLAGFEQELHRSRGKRRRKTTDLDPGAICMKRRLDMNVRGLSISAIFSQASRRAFCNLDPQTHYCNAR